MQIYEIFILKKTDEKIIIEGINENGLISVEIQNEGHAIMTGEFLKYESGNYYWNLFANDHQWIELKKYRKKTIFDRILNFFVKKLEKIGIYS